MNLSSFIVLEDGGFQRRPVPDRGRLVVGGYFAPISLCPDGPDDEELI